MRVKKKRTDCYLLIRVEDSGIILCCDEHEWTQWLGRYHVASLNDINTYARTHRGEE